MLQEYIVTVNEIGGSRKNNSFYVAPQTQSGQAGGFLQQRIIMTNITSVSRGATYDITVAVYYTQNKISNYSAPVRVTVSKCLNITLW